MNFNRAQFLRAMEIVGRVVSSATTLQVLKFVRMQASGSAVTLTATDLSRWMEVRWRDEGLVADPVDLLIPLEKFQRILALGGSPEFEMDVKKHVIHYRSGASEYKLCTFSVDEFPPQDAGYWAFDNSQACRVTEGAFARLLKGVFPMASTDDKSRPALCGVQLEMDPGMVYAVATNGKALGYGMMSAQVNVSARGTLTPLSVRALAGVLDVESDDELRIVMNSKGKIQFSSGGVIFMADLEQAPFVNNWRQVVPQYPEGRGGEFAVADMARAMRMAESFTSNENPRVDLVILESELRVSAGVDAVGESNSGVRWQPVKPDAWRGEGVGVNPDYLKSAVSMVAGDGEKAKLFFGVELNVAPICVTSVCGKRTAVVMPLRAKGKS